MALTDEALGMLDDLAELEANLLRRARRLAEIYSLDATPKQSDVDKFYAVLRDRFLGSYRMPS